MDFETKRLVDVPFSEQISGTYTFVVNDNGVVAQVKKEEMSKYFGGIKSWSQLLDKPFEEIDSTQFDASGGSLKLKGYHIHDNIDILNMLSINDESQLLFNGDIITLKADNDTIKNNDGILSADVIGNWVGGNTYNVGYFAVYNDNLYECIVANSDTEWTESHWRLIGSSGGTTGTTINNWSASTDYKINDLVINETTLYQCKTEHTSGETFDETELANWTALTGARGEKGNDGYSPTASVEQTDTGCTITVTDANGTTTANLSNGKDGTNGKDGASPTIDPTTKNWVVGTVDTGVKAEAQSNYFYTGIEFPTSDLIDGDLYLSFAESTRGNVYQYQESTFDWSLQGNLYGGGAVIDDTSTIGNTVTWSASKINSIIGNINTILASITGGIT